ncbi:hypothetical protein Sme01_29880 [Sphaerisporangium melleum]|uniref:Band 7 domain-containing protein n=1 Tax=Sphaerisporangium melleum TaxID=321316 RepID=A0A917R2N3_9ACTN|nr:hypothetical protein GCM10007964_29660 [Sphaerisporangium melleum]GII70512.1 hypothetical protein Sme01_29880 [Sphaerisporangium melleum]
MSEPATPDLNATALDTKPTTGREQGPDEVAPRRPLDFAADLRQIANTQNIHHWNRYRPPPVPLILLEEPVASASQAPIVPGRALLYSDVTGEVHHLPRPPMSYPWRRYRFRYEVDLSDHYVTFRVEVPSRSEASRFRLVIDVGWRVTDPVRIVKSRIRDGNEIVLSRVTEAVRPICRGYEIEEDSALERHLTESLGLGRVHDYPEGISMFRFSAQVAQKRPVSEQTAAARMAVFGLRSQLRTEEDLILMLLQRAPDRVGDVIADIRRRKEMTMQSRIELFNKMVDNDLIQEAEMESIRQLILRPVESVGIIESVRNIESVGNFSITTHTGTPDDDNPVSEEDGKPS